MSTTQIPYAEALTKIASLEKKLTEFTATTTKVGKSDEDKELEASFKKAQSEMKNEDKDHKATMDENEKVKDAFKRATDETDPEKKKEAMNKAMEMKKDHDDKKARKAGETPKEDKDPAPKEAAITENILKKIPLMTKILEATRIMDAPNYEKVEKELTAATLQEVEAKYAAIAPYIAAVGITNKTQMPAGMMGMVPFQADAALNKTNPENIFEGSVDSIDFNKVTTKQIQEMYQ